MAQNTLSTAFSLGLPLMLPRRAAGFLRLDLYLLPLYPAVTVRRGMLGK